MKIKIIFLFMALGFQPNSALAEARDIGSVTTALKILGPSHKIAVSAFDDPQIRGVTCYIARPRTGGIKGGLGLAEDPSIASVSCVQTGPITFVGKIDADDSGDEVFNESRSIIFKTLKINRMYDTTNGSFVYVVRTTKIVDGAPATSVSVVAPTNWNGIAPQKPSLK